MNDYQMRLRGRRVAALVTDGFEQVELTEPLRVLQEQGADVEVIAPGGGSVRSWNKTDWGMQVEATRSLDVADAADYDALLLPGGVMSPDHLRMDQQAVAFVRSFADAGKPIAAICHGPWTLINAEAVRGRSLTSYPSLQRDLENAGAAWVDREVVVDGNLVTSRKPDDLPAFNRSMIDLFTGKQSNDGQVSSAPNNSFATGTGVESIGEDPAALAGNTLGNASYPEGNTYPQTEADPNAAVDRRDVRRKKTDRD